MQYPKTPFGIMFHHFHDGKQHPYIQGALTAEEFRDVLTGANGLEILPAQTWLDLFYKGELKPTQSCITFDDALQCQYDIALPIMEELGLTAFWFVYSSVFEGVMEPFELHRFFKNVAYDSVEDFNRSFIDGIRRFQPDAHDWDAIVVSDSAKKHLSEHHFYSESDRLFRYIRDIVLTPQEFADAMESLMQEKGFSAHDWVKSMWMDDDCLRDLKSRGHVIGLHSYSHPVNFRRLELSEQVREYFKNVLHLTKVLGEAPGVMAHPSNSYNDATLEILKGFGVRCGFRSDPAESGGTPLEIARIDSLDLKNARKRA
ncbi:MAG: polysaccharide deacetylase family protein [Alphaproteobacteria bacterium]|nr:polysaccharide deacetylase family protein [Alphaproteobacteria bacterium]